jgi:hypothetical protein
MGSNTIEKKVVLSKQKKESFNQTRLRIYWCKVFHMATCFDSLRVIFRPKTLMIYPISCTYEMSSSWLHVSTHKSKHVAMWKTLHQYCIYAFANDWNFPFCFDIIARNVMEHLRIKESSFVKTTNLKHRNMWTKKISKIILHLWFHALFSINICIKCPTRCNTSILISLQDYSTCFWYFLSPSSGVQ